jgi:alcohol-forming fatty acyl-CoA reductase
MSAAVAPRRVGAFFDVDGTLMGPPSLERRFFAELRRRRAIPAKNYFLWLAYASRLMPRGVAMIQHANKMYLRDVRVAEAPANLFGPAGIPVVNETAFERLTSHALQGHAIVLVTGALAPLARNFALQIIIKLAARGITASVGVCANELEEVGGRWTGRIIAEPMFGEAKARAVKRVAFEQGLDLARSYAYGDSATDRWMLETVGRPVAMNPSAGLELIAQRNDWAVLWWSEKARESPQRAQRKTEVFVGPGEFG